MLADLNAWTNEAGFEVLDLQANETLNDQSKQDQRVAAASQNPTQGPSRPLTLHMPLHSSWFLYQERLLNLYF